MTTAETGDKAGAAARTGTRAGTKPAQAASPSGPRSRAGQSGAPPHEPGSRPLRKDAERNRVRILAAAAEVFTEQGLQATLDDVAARAGVGVGTVYRRFPDKEAIVEVLFTERFAALAGFAEQALADPDPWAGLVTFFERAAGLIAGDRGLRQILMFASYGHDRVDQARSRMLPVVSRMIQRAQEAGAVRADLRPTDVPVIEFMLGMLGDYAAAVRPDLWRRYLALILDALRPERAGASELPEPALSPDELSQAMRTGSLRRF
jgi:AcrR family transcriptional regulator